MLYKQLTILLKKISQINFTNISENILKFYKVHTIIKNVS